MATTKKRTPIAEIALMPGQGGYWDPLSRIHMTAGNPHAIVYGGTNCAQLRRSVKAGRIRLVWGTLGSHVSPFKVELVNGKYVIAPNEEDMKPVEVTEPPADDAAAQEVIRNHPAKAPAAVKTDAVAESKVAVEKKETKAEEPKEEAKKAAVEEKAEKAATEEKKPAADEKPAETEKKTTAKKAPAKKAARNKK